MNSGRQSTAQAWVTDISDGSEETNFLPWGVSLWEKEVYQKTRQLIQSQGINLQGRETKGNENRECLLALSEEVNYILLHNYRESGQPSEHIWGLWCGPSGCKGSVFVALPVVISNTVTYCAKNSAFSSWVRKSQSRHQKTQFCFRKCLHISRKICWFKQNTSYYYCQIF